jgi:hypothetical protein
MVRGTVEAVMRDVRSYAINKRNSLPLGSSLVYDNKRDRGGERRKVAIMMVSIVNSEEGIRR